ncbi:hypothetical protein ACEWY4_017869 [Coilia grayii]|uniref:IF rod domain-containing protein n=1 Tax=Coilia grayii TaxID=363190 RepID=A0ABD1JI52_9TELE
MCEIATLKPFEPMIQMEKSLEPTFCGHGTIWSSGGESVRYGTGYGLRQHSLSMCGGAGGRGVRISTATTQRPFFDYFSGPGVGLYYNEKATMQNLNDRLASYLDKVRSLEKANAELELKIREWLGQRIVVSQDYSRYQVSIEEMYTKIRLARSAKAKIRLDIENAALAANDFRMKYESEVAMTQVVMADISSFRADLDQLTLLRTDLELRFEGGKEELVFMKKNHMEEMAMLRTQVPPNVHVEVDGPPQEDLGRILEEIRIQYESRIQKATREIEAWYQKMLRELGDIPDGGWNVELDRLRIQLSEMRRSAQKLEIEIQSSIRVKSALEMSLQETKSRYSFELTEIQSIISSLESDISQLRMDMERQRSEYNMLLDIKIRLEMEIAEYRRLLDGDMQ